MGNTLSATGISVANLDRAVDFYTRVLGMTAKQTFKLPNMNEVVVGFERGAAIVLMEYTDGATRDHAAFAGKLVFYVDDPRAIVERVRKEGLEIVREAAKSDFGPSELAFVRDVDGYLLELIQVPG